MKSQSLDMEHYFATLEKEVKKTYEIAKKARSKGYDPEREVEIPLAKNMAERVEGLISISAPEIINKGIPERIQELEKQYGKLDWRVALSIALEVAQEKFCKFETKIKAIETAIRIGFAYVTVGVVSSPLEGFVKLELKKRMDNQKEYFCLYYSGPVRSAGGTGASVSLLIADYLRKQFNYEKFDPTDKEIKRVVTELYDYHERITNLQYLPSPEEIEFMVSHLPLQVDGDPSEKVEVSNYKDLPRTETNRIRNGVCLVYGECIIQKAPKVFKQLSKWGKDFNLEDWDFMEEFVNLQKKIKSKGVKKEDKEEKLKSDYTFIKDIVAGRPVITYPKYSGGLRLRYGRSRNTGLSATGMHPATLYILNNFIAIGTQLKTERPGKGTTINSTDSIEGPIVKLKNGEVLILEDTEQAKKVAKEVEEILYLGDILISYGDFFNRAHSLVPAGFCEEYWIQLLEEKESSPEKIAQATNLDIKFITDLFKNPLGVKPTVQQALKLSKLFNIPFHPLYTYHWTDIKHEDLGILLTWLEEKTIKEEKLILPFKVGSEERIKSKRVLEILGIPHKIVANEYIVIPEEHTVGLRVALGMYEKEGSLVSIDQNKSVLDIINEIAEVSIKDKSGTYIGARMGRPEKAKVRKLTGSPHGLFPVGEEGGRLRCFQSALEATKVTAEFPINYCESCKKESIYQKCHLCDNPTTPQYWCKECKKQQKEKECKIHGVIPNYKYQELPIKEYYEVEQKRLKVASLPELIKGIRGTSNKNHIPEHLVKAVLRSIHNIYVNKDGTIRYDMTELPITHFKPKEIGTPIEKLNKLGYNLDIYNQPLVTEDQIVEIRPQDIILPACTEGDEEGSDIILFKTAKFVDDLLVHLYQEKPFYNLSSKEGLMGQLVVSLAPHTSAGIISRIIGFSKTQGFYAHPMLHCAVRRDCYTQDTFISIFDGNIWRNERIGDIVEKLNPQEVVDAFGTKEIKVENLFTLGFNPETNRIEVVPIYNFTKHTPTDVIKITTQDGRILKTTTSHKFNVKQDNKIVKKRASELVEGELLVVPQKFDIQEKDIEGIDLKKYFLNREDIMIRNIKPFIKKIICNLKRNSIKEILNLNESTLPNFLSRDSFPLPFLIILLALNNRELKEIPKESKIAIKRDTVTLPTNIPLNDDVLYMIGVYIAEGYSRGKSTKKGLYQVDIAITEKEIRRRVKSAIKKYFNLVPTWETEERIVYSSRIFKEFFTDILKAGHNAKTKRVPPIFLTLPESKIKPLLQGYYDGDGSVSLSDCRAACDSISEGLLSDLEFILRRLGIYSKRYIYKKQPGPKVREFYIKHNKPIPEFQITKLTILSNHLQLFHDKVGFYLKRKQDILKRLLKEKKPVGMRILSDENLVYPKIKKIEILPSEPTYCLNVKYHNVIANGVTTGQCDGDEVAIILLLDCLLNFSRKFLPDHRGSTQDAPLVLTSIITPTEVDDMVFDMDVSWKYPLELYRAAEAYKMPWEVKIEILKDNLGTEKQFERFGFTHHTTDINRGVRWSAYKSIPTMGEKVLGQMNLAEKIRAVDTADVARLVIERHFIRDIKGNLRKFSMQQFRCVNCNKKFRRPPLLGKCTKCKGKLIFTISEGSVTKYLHPSIDLAKKYNLPTYLQQTLEITQNRVDSVFGKDKEKQDNLQSWFA